MYEIFTKLLDERGITAYRVHMETGISQSVLSAWKNGVTTPRNPTLKKIADYFDVSVAYLKGETEDRGQKNTPSREGGARDEEIKAAFWGGDKDLSPADIDALWDDAKAYIKFKTQQKKGKP